METTCNFNDYVKAGYPAIVMNTHEEKRALDACREVAKSQGMSLAVWTLTKGFEFYRSNGKNVDLPRNPTAAKKTLDVNVVFTEVNSPNYEDQKNKGSWNILYCVLDFHPYIKTPNIWRQAKDQFDWGKSVGVTYVFISANFDVPSDLEKEVTIVSLPLPTREEIEQILVSLLDKNPRIERPADNRNLVEAALGLTAFEVENTFSLSIAAKGYLDVEIIKSAKQQIICNEGILDYRPSKETLETIGGLKGFTSWAQDRLAAFSPEAQAYGLPYPKGVLLVGIPGCGKSLVAKALANIWQKPLLTLDIGKLFNKYQGETDRNTRLVFEKAEAMAPAVLYIDEIEKAFAGAQSSGETDGGTTMRMFGNFLTWLQEKESPVFVIATANDVSKLPAEFLRKGRFDEIFFVDLPDEEERQEIVGIQLKKYKRDPNAFDIPALAKATEYYTGAEIEEAVVSSLFYAYNDGGREPTTEDVMKFVKEITPMAIGVMQGRVEYLRDWADKTKVRRASGKEVTNEQVAEAPNGRVIRVDEPEEEAM